MKKLYTNDIQRLYWVISSIANLKQFGMDISSYGGRMYALGKHIRVLFPKRLDPRTKSPFELVHIDVWVPSRSTSTLGFHYFVTFIDNYS